MWVPPIIFFDLPLHFSWFGIFLEGFKEVGKFIFNIPPTRIMLLYFCTYVISILCLVTSSSKIEVLKFRKIFHTLVAFSVILDWTVLIWIKSVYFCLE